MYSIYSGRAKEIDIQTYSRKNITLLLNFESHVDNFKSTYIISGVVA